MKSAAAGKKWGGVAGSAFFVIFADVMRKLFSRYALSAIVAPLLAVGCNDGVFIDDFLPEAPSVTVGPDDTSVTIRFEAGNWDILSVEGPTTSLRGDIYDAEGNLLYGNHPLYIGRRAGASLPFNGRLYGLIVRGAATDDNHLTHAEKYLAYKSGVSL